MFDPFMGVLFAIAIICLIVGLLIWILRQFTLPAPWGRIAEVCIAVLAVLAIISKLLPFVR